MRQRDSRIEGSEQAGHPRGSEVHSFRLDADVTLHALRTGWVQVKRAHREWNGPAALRLPAILLGRRWTDWLPIWCWAIETPDGVTVVDTGETHLVAQERWFHCDAGTGWFYDNNLRFRVPSEADEVGPLLQRVGIDPVAVRTVVQTHMHSDHCGGLGWFPNAEVWVPEVGYRSVRGALPCRLPSDFSASSTTFEDGSCGPFEKSRRLSEVLWVVPTAGHSRGHQSVVVELDGRRVLLAGDVCFDQRQLQQGLLAGICEDMAAARRSLHQVGELQRAGACVVLPSHDPRVGELLAEFASTRS